MLPSRWMVAAMRFLSFVLAEDVLWTGGAVGGSAREADAAGARELGEAVRSQDLLEGLELVGRADDLEDDRVGAEVGHSRVEDAGERHQLDVPARVGLDLDQRELALDRLAGFERGDAED